jgi:hypothetical protein
MSKSLLSMLVAASLATAALATPIPVSAQATAWCDPAAVRQSAWFERQRELTDGDTNPFVMPLMPAQCAAREPASKDRLASK